MPSIQSQHRPFSRRGLTLIEIMIALTMTLIVLGAMMQAFQYASGQMQLGRATMELANRLRSAEELLRSDLSHLTVEPRPYTETTNPNGYFEIIDGVMRDKTTKLKSINNPDLIDNSYLGDVDDVIAMTVRSDGQLFRGRHIPDNTTSSKVIESSIAEVMWYTTYVNRNTNQVDVPRLVPPIELTESVKVHRRVLLIRPDMGPWEDLTSAEVTFLMQNNDISCRIVFDPNDSNYNVYANNLSDLAIRKNRFCHQWPTFTEPDNPTDWPNELKRPYVSNFQPLKGEDIVLTDVASFDVQVYSPDVSLILESGDDAIIQVEYFSDDPGRSVDPPLGPQDIGFSGSLLEDDWTTAVPPNVISAGSFVDLDSGDSRSNTRFATPDLGLVNDHDQSQWRDFEPFYDTWTPAYESDGIDQDGINGIDQGTNGLDNAGNSPAPDDNGERETNPPYPYPIRGVKVSLRLIEKTTNQVYQSSVTHSYVPE